MCAYKYTDDARSGAYKGLTKWCAYSKNFDLLSTEHNSIFLTTYNTDIKKN